jgi:hypothetical protein
VTTTAGEPSNKDVPLSGGAWTQAPDESDQVIGQATYTGNGGQLNVHVNGTQTGAVGLPVNNGPTPTIFNFTFTSEDHRGDPGWPPWLFEPGTRIRNVVTADVRDNITGGVVTVSQISINVLGFR